MKSFEFQNYRDKLAQDLVDTRNKEGRDSAMEKLKVVKTTENYNTTEILQRASNELPKDAIKEAVENKEVIVDSEKWNVTDISGLIPDDLKYSLDGDTLRGIEHRLNSVVDVDWNKKQWPVNNKLSTIPSPYRPKADDAIYEHEERVELLDKAGREFLNEISGQRYLDNHTFNHIVGALASGGMHKYSGKAFDPHSIIEPSQAEIEHSKFWMYPAGLRGKATKPLVIFSQDNPNTRSFFEQEFHPNIEEVMKNFIEEEKKDPEKFFNDLKARVIFDDEGFVGFDVMGYYGFPNLARIFFLAGIPMSGRKQYSDKIDGQIEFPFETRNQALARRKEGQDSPDNLILKTTWMDIADCIIDIQQGKVWTRKYSDEETEQVDLSKKHYKEWIEQNLFHCTTEEFVERAKER